MMKVDQMGEQYVFYIQDTIASRYILSSTFLINSITDIQLCCWIWSSWQTCGDAMVATINEVEELRKNVLVNGKVKIK